MGRRSSSRRIISPRIAEFSDPESIAYINFADDTYILARTAMMFEFELAVLQSELRAVGQILNMKKSEVLTRDAEEESVPPPPPPRSWSDEELGAYEARGAEAPNTSTSPIGRPPLAVARAMAVLGSEISFNPSRPEALPARLNIVWQKFSLIEAQLQMRVAPIRARVQLLDVVIQPTMLYGMETVHITTVMRRKVDATQGTLIGRLLPVLRKPTEDLQAYFRRRQRLITTTIAKYARGTWSQLWRYRQLTFLGHLVRLRPYDHLSARLQQWRGSRWWAIYKRTLPPGTGWTPGRRPAGLVQPLQHERFVQESFARLRRDRRWPGQVGHAPFDWVSLAELRPAWRAFARWLACHLKQ